MTHRQFNRRAKESFRGWKIAIIANLIGFAVALGFGTLVGMLIR